MQKAIDTMTSLGKILGPALFAYVFLFGGLGYGILDMYKFNVNHNITNSFPSQFIINFYFYAVLVGIVFLIIIISIQTRISSNMKIDAPTQTNKTTESA